MRSVTPSGHESRRLDLHEHHPVYKTGALLFGHVGTSTSARSRTPYSRFGSCLLSQEHTRVGLPTNQPGAVIVNYFPSSTFQYASLTNFDQLSNHNSWSAFSAFYVRQIGLLRSRILACWGVRLSFRLLQARHASTQFSQRDSPPCERGMTWSSVNSSLPG